MKKYLMVIDVWHNTTMIESLEAKNIEEAFLKIKKLSENDEESLLNHSSLYNLYLIDQSLVVFDKTPEFFSYRFERDKMEKEKEKEKEEMKELQRLKEKYERN